jgi:hypothetical protein
MRRPKPDSRRKGYKLVAALVSTVILVAAFTVSIEAFYAGGRAIAYGRHLAIASAICQSEMEQLRGEGLPAGLVGTRRLQPQTIGALPLGHADLEVQPAAHGLRRVRVRVTWQSRDGPPHEAEIITLMRAKGR